MMKYTKQQQDRMTELAVKVVMELGFDAPSFKNKVYAAYKIKNGMSPQNKSDSMSLKD